ncbi:MAG TPA: ornithine carbamoyltransferase [Thermoleophilia bacterium]|nr:ornithine carbamoyltransferase [Thermoleophilia bacterium]
MKHHFQGRDFLKLADFTPEEVGYFVDTAIELKRKRATGEVFEPLRGKTIALIFEKLSTRTRVSFQTGAAHLGAQTFYMSPDQMQAARGEPIRDTARIIDRYCDGLFIRTFGQEIVEEYAHYMRNPVINALTNLTHPCQGLCDLMTMKEKKGGYKGLKVGYLGDIWNVCHSLMMGCAMMGAEFYAAQPNDSYRPDAEQLATAQKWAELSGSRIVYTADLEEVASDADVIYGNTWHSMATENKEQRLVDFAPYQVNMRVIEMAKPDVIYMHCLPGYRGEDMVDEVIESPCCVFWDQGENRMHTEKAVLALVMA